MTASRRLIVGITGGTPTVAGGHDGTERGRPDAWILTDRWAILIESKLGARIGSDQLRCHAESAGWKPGSYELALLTWQQIQTEFRDQLARQRRFPLRQPQCRSTRQAPSARCTIMGHGGRIQRTDRATERPTGEHACVRASVTTRAG
jgi:hypothetical protein